MIRYLLRVLQGHLGPGRTLYALTLFGVALGVASVLCIQILNRNAIGAFAGSVRAISGEADLSVMGRAGGVREDLLASALGDPSVRGAWPLHRVQVEIGTGGGDYLELVGFDLMLPAVLPWLDSEWDAAGALRDPGWVAVSPQLAEERGWVVGSVIEARRGTRRTELQVGALIDFKRISPAAGRRLAVMDIAQTQGLFGEPGMISQVDLVLHEDADAEAAQASLSARLGPVVRVVTPEQREQEAAGLLAAFRFNLTALSLISLLVGLFLVHSSTQAGLVRRRREFGILRCLGVSRARIVGLILAEVALLGVCGVAIGLPLGYLAAAANVEVVSQTLTNIYLLDAIDTLRLPAWLWILAALVGIGGATAGALLPAIDVSRRPARSLLADYTLHERTARWAPTLAFVGGGLGLAAGTWYLLLASAWRPAGFVLGICLLTGLSLMAPVFIRATCRRVTVRGFGFSYSIRTLVTRLTTTSFAVASLAVAVSMLVGITIMIGSFRGTLVDWITTSVRADIYVTATAGGRVESDVTLPVTLVDAVRALPEVEHIDRLRRVRPFVGERRITLSAIDMGLAGDDRRFILLAGEADPARLRREPTVLISEPLSRKGDLGIGDLLRVATPDGEAALEIVAVYADYGSESGAALMDLEGYAALFGPGMPSSLALYLTPGTDVEALADRLKGQLGSSSIRVRSNRRLRREVLDIFDQTFAVTAIVQTMSLLIAAAGVTLSLLIIARHRVSELALYRALGARRRQIFGIFMGKGLAIGALGLSLGGVGGVLLALILVQIINPAWFGWTLVLHWPLVELVREFAAILGASALAAVYPALRASGTPATELSRDNVA